MRVVVCLKNEHDLPGNEYNFVSLEYDENLHMFLFYDFGNTLVFWCSISCVAYIRFEDYK